MALGDSSLAGLARVAYETVGLADFAADNQKAETSYRDATRGMSDEAIRLSLAQDKLRRALAQGPNAYRQIARAELDVRRSEQALRMENERLERSFRDTGRTLDRAGRGALLGSGMFRGLARSISFASAGFLGGAGLVYGMRQAINVASNLEEQQNKVRVVFDNSAESVLQWARGTASAIGIAQDQALSAAGSIGNMVTALGLGEDQAARMSIRMVQLAADMASFNNEDPTDMLERIRSGLSGELEPLRRFGSVLSAARVEQFAWANGIAESGQKLTEQQKILARYGLLLQDTQKQQGDFARTSDGLANSQRQLSALWRETQGLIGQALIPAYGDAVRGLRDWLAEDKNRVELQRTINALVGDAEKIVRGFAGGLGVAADAASPLVKALGGVENTIRAITLLWLGFKAKAILGFAGTAAASRATSASMVRDAVVAGRAWDLATRPRMMTVTTAGVPLGGPAGRGGRLGRGLGLLGLSPGGATVTGAALLTYFGIRSGQRDPISPETYRKLKQAAISGSFTYAQLDELSQFLTDAQEREIRGLIARANARVSGAGESPDSRDGARGPGAIAAQNRHRRQRQRQDAAFTFADVEAGLAGSDERLLDAQATPGASDDVREWRRRLALVNRALRELKLTRDQRLRLKQERVALLNDLARIEQEEEQEAQKIREQRQRKREEAARKAREQQERIDRVAARAAEERRDLLAGTGGNRANMRRAALRHVDDVLKDLRKKKPADEARDLQRQVRESQFEFLQSLQGIMNQFGGNLFASLPGGSDPRVYTELKAQTDVLRALATNARQPGTTHAKNEIDAAFAGAAF